MEDTGHPLVLLVVGTDHHPFDRAVSWVDGWAAQHVGRVRVVIQHGTSGSPVTAEGHDVLPVDELDALMAEATAVVCHGGPGTIMGARNAGVVPIAIARQSELGEHVDDHQVRFVTRLGAAGQVHVARTETDLTSLLDQAVGGAVGFRLDAAEGDPAGDAVARFSALVDRLLASGTKRSWR